ncbi:MAG: sialate O-acetylesterase [Muribaculaceae bacterium]|nr:sialate O-acetylesterase [Muribaculaceae bacterium]
MIRRIFWILAVLMMVCRAFADIPNDFDVYLLIGQSNMAGRGPLEASDTTNVIDGVWLLNAEGVPEPAVAPLNKYSTIRKELSLQGYNPGSEFGKIMHRDSGRPILLVVHARGGSHIAEWQSDNSNGYFKDAVTRTQEAMKYGMLKGILWNQGETDVQKKTWDYPEKFSAMISELRKVLEAEDIPVVVGEVGRWNWAPKEDIERFNETIIPATVELVPNCKYVSSKGLKRRFEDKERDPHYSRSAQIELGRRYAAQIKK